MSSPVRKDPTAAFLLAICLPGAGHMYAGAAAVGVVLLVVLSAAWWETGYDSVRALAPAAAQVLTALHASKLAAEWNRARAPEPLPPPPPASMTAPRAVPSQAAAAPPPPPQPAPVQGPALDPDAFLSEVRTLWRDHRSGSLSEEDYRRAKASAIARVRVTDVDEGYALLEAASALVAAGVLTPEDRGRLQRQAASR